MRDRQRLDPADDGADPVALGAAASRDRAAYRRANRSRPPTPASTRSPATMSPARAVRMPCCSPVGGLGPLQPAQQRPDEHRHRRHAEQHDTAPAAGETDHSTTATTAYAMTAPTPGPVIVSTCETCADVGAADRGDLARGEPARQHRADPGQVTQQDLRRAGRRVLADEGHRAVPHDAQPRQRDAGDDDRARPSSSSAPGVVGAQPVVDGAGDQVRPHREPDHPGRADQAAPQHPPRAGGGPATRCTAAGPSYPERPGRGAGGSGASAQAIHIRPETVSHPDRTRTRANGTQRAQMMRSWFTGCTGSSPSRWGRCWD